MRRLAWTSWSMLGLWPKAISMASSTDARGSRARVTPATSQTASASSMRTSNLLQQQRIRAHLADREPGQRGQRARGRVEDDLGPLRAPGVVEGVRRQPAGGQQLGEPPDLLGGRRARLERPDLGVAGCVVAHHAGRRHRAGRDDAPADDARHELGDHVLVAQPVLDAARRPRRRAQPGPPTPPRACAGPWSRRCRSRRRAGHERPYGRSREPRTPRARPPAGRSPRWRPCARPTGRRPRPRRPARCARWAA